MKTSTKMTSGLRVKTSIKAGGLRSNHNSSLSSPKTTPGLRVKTSIKAGGLRSNHNSSLTCSR